jgi:6-phosphogluconate dehydrogenase
MTNFQIGVVGLGVMGANLARNFASRGIHTVVYNRTAEKTTAFLDQYQNEFLSGKTVLKEFVDSLPSHRVIFLMLKAGNSVDAFLEELLPLLSSEDIVVDGGNSHFHDTIRRERALAEKGIFFVGCGVSGGEEGALIGPSLMPGGAKVAVERILPMLQKISARDFEGKPCVTNLGENASGHYTKMVHNGIEYAVMQIFADAYTILRKAFGLSAKEIGEIFAQWKNSPLLSSYLLDIAVEVLDTRDAFTDEYLIDMILDCAAQKGTGKWTLEDAAERGIAIPSIAEAVTARVVSSNIKIRTRLSQELSSVSSVQFEKMLSTFLSDLQRATELSILLAYTQGFSLLFAASEEMKWDLRRDEVCRIWQGGCIIRAESLKFFRNILQETPNESILLSPLFIQEIQLLLPYLRSVVAKTASCGYFVPGFSSSLLYIEGMSEKKSGANFIQALRDRFGAHGFERTDREGVFHGSWNDILSL